jgi:hypothetical protein
VLAVLAATTIAACGSNSPSSAHSSASSGRPSFAQMQREAVRFSSCMRSHNVPAFPDPTTSPRGFKIALNPNVSHSPAFNAAFGVCRRLLPNGGQPSQPSPPSHAQLVAMLAFAHCIRSHGFPNFPDPSSGGQLTHEMIAAAGIDIHQPAVRRAGDACVSVTHGLLTRADVAHFVAGH